MCVCVSARIYINEPKNKLGSNSDALLHSPPFLFIYISVAYNEKYVFFFPPLKAE